MYPAVLRALLGVDEGDLVLDLCLQVAEPFGLCVALKLRDGAPPVRPPCAFCTTKFSAAHFVLGQDGNVYLTETFKSSPGARASVHRLVSRTTEPCFEEYPLSATRFAPDVGNPRRTS